MLTCVSLLKAFSPYHQTFSLSANALPALFNSNNFATQLLPVNCGNVLSFVRLIAGAS